MQHHWIHIPELDSTNVEAGRRIGAGMIRENTLLYADYQEVGKGQGVNTWVSDRGKNLLMSWVVFPAFLSVDRQFQLSKLVAVSIIDLLAQHGIIARIKWPNDILVDRRKIAGILIEHSILGTQLQHSILGMGINLNQQQFPRFDVPATSYLLEKGHAADPGPFRSMLADILSSKYDLLASGHHEGLDSSYTDGLFGLGGEHTFERDGCTFRGRINGVNNYGELLIEESGLTQAFGMHSVKLLL
jgi:BirA family biotin operon repressor/biotin-[acetyl-CoA-carboxylase] ligase